MQILEHKSHGLTTGSFNVLLDFNLQLIITHKKRRINALIRLKSLEVVKSTVNRNFEKMVKVSGKSFCCPGGDNLNSILRLVFKNNAICVSILF